LHAAQGCGERRQSAESLVCAGLARVAGKRFRARIFAVQQRHFAVVADEVDALPAPASIHEPSW